MAMRRRYSRECGHIVLKEVNLFEDDEGVVKKAVCADCQAVVVTRYSFLRRFVYDKKGNVVARY